MHFLLLILSALAGKWDGVPSDIAASGSVSASPEQVYEHLLSLDNLHALFSEACVSEWENGNKSSGFGATAAVRYDFGPMHRRLALTISKGEPGRYLDLDHPGKKGFVTRFMLAPSATGTAVEMTTRLNPPPWPVKSVFYNRVMPEWKACYEAALTQLDAAL